MKYTNEQYRLMERLQSGVIWDDLDEQEQDILRYLDCEKISEPRAYIQDGLWVLSQEGQTVLETHRHDTKSAEEQALRLDSLERFAALSAQPKVDKKQYPGNELKKRKINWGKVFAEVISIVGLLASIVAIIEFLFGVLG